MTHEIHNSGSSGDLRRRHPGRQRTTVPVHRYPDNTLDDDHGNVHYNPINDDLNYNLDARYVLRVHVVHTYRYELVGTDPDRRIRYEHELYDVFDQFGDPR